jgi:hypothetical protein
MCLHPARFNGCSDADVFTVNNSLCCTLVSCAQGEDLKVLPKAKLGSNHWVFLTAAMPAAQLGASTHGSAGSSGGSSVHSEQTA